MFDFMVGLERSGATSATSENTITQRNNEYSCSQSNVLYCYDCRGVNLDLCFPRSVRAVRTWWRSPWMCLYASFSLIATSCGKQAKTTLQSTTPNPHQRLLSFLKETRPNLQRVQVNLNLWSPALLSQRTEGLHLTYLLCQSLVILLWRWIVGSVFSFVQFTFKTRVIAYVFYLRLS